MDTDRLPLDLDQETLKNRRYWYFLSALLFLVSLISQQAFIFLAALFTLLIALIPDLWYRFALRKMTITMEVDQRQISFGEEVTLSISIENRKLLPLPWLEVENRVTPPLSSFSRRVVHLQKTDLEVIFSTWLLWPLERVTRRYHLRCRLRGLHAFGPLRLGSSDPFGWMDGELNVPVSTLMMVYPLVVPLETFGLSSAYPFGDYLAPRRLFEDPLRIAGIREYMIGDDPRRIHWKATAHTGALRSKIYEPSTTRRLLVVLDAWSYADDLKGPDIAVQELSITAAASIAIWGLEQGYIVGLLSNCAMMLSSLEDNQLEQALIKDQWRDMGQLLTMNVSAPHIRIPFSGEEAQHELLLSTLARLVPSYSSALERVFETEEEMFQYGTTVVLVSAASSLHATTIEQLLDLRKQGLTVHLALTGDEAARSETYQFPTHYLGGRRKWHELTSAVTGDAQEAYLRLD